LADSGNLYSKIDAFKFMNLEPSWKLFLPPKAIREK